MIIKHGLTVADIGKGELSASLEGLQLVTGIVLPPLAGALYNVSPANRLPAARLPALTCLAARLAAQFFLHPPRSTPAYLRWGPGGSYMVGAGLYMLSTRYLWSTDPQTLYVDDDGRTPDRKVATKR